jgi:hypothetical protein
LLLIKIMGFYEKINERRLKCGFIF